MRYVPPTKTMAGQKFHRLTAVEFVRADHHYNQYWRFSCDCGKEIVTNVGNVRSGHAKSCGCYSREIHAECLTNLNLTHGAARHGEITPEYTIWQGMIARCENPKHASFKYYGARGIRVSEPFRSSFEAFIADAGLRPTAKHTIDRINNDGNYEPGNVRWATRTQQNMNKRRGIKSTSEASVAAT